MRATVPVIVAAALLLPACGGSSAAPATGEAARQPGQILRDATRSVHAARSVHYTVSVPGFQSDITRAAPDRIAGYYTARNGHRVTFVRYGNRLYLRSTPWFWKALSKPGQLAQYKRAAELTAGQWLLLPPSQSRLFTPPTPIHRLAQIRGVGGTFVNDGDTTYNGTTVIALNAGNATLYVQPTRRAYPIAFVNSQGSAGFTFDHWNAPLTVTAPRHAIDLAKLTR